jgi:hypothetical protein
MVDQSRPSATSRQVKSNSLRATKSTAGPACRLSVGLTATLAPTKPIFTAGLMSFINCATLASELNDGVEVWMMISS